MCPPALGSGDCGKQSLRGCRERCRRAAQVPSPRWQQRSPSSPQPHPGDNLHFTAPANSLPAQQLAQILASASSSHIWSKLGIFFSPFSIAAKMSGPDTRVLNVKRAKNNVQSQRNSAFNLGSVKARSRKE